MVESSDNDITLETVMRAVTALEANYEDILEKIQLLSHRVDLHEHGEDGSAVIRLKNF